MRYLKLLFLSAVFVISNTCYSQTALSINNPSYYFSNDSIVSGTMLHYQTSIFNISPAITYTGNITYTTAIDTMGTGGTNFLNLDSLQTDTLVNVSLNPGDSVNTNDSIALIINYNCRGGINTVVIWPIADMGSSFVTADTLRHDIFVIDPLSGLKNVIRKEPIVISPNPFSDKISIISPSKIAVERVRILDMQGAVVYENKSTSRSYIETGGLAQGVYFVEITFVNGTRTIIKTIKQ